MDPITDEEDVMYYLGKLYAQEKDYLNAIKAYKEGLAINPKSAILLYEIGLVDLKVNNRKQALKYWEKLLSIMSPHSYLAIEVKQKLKRGNLLDKYEDNAVTFSYRV